jgi:uncharacterized protein with beta-barrel porin domain
MDRNGSTSGRLLRTYAVVTGIALGAGGSGVAHAANTSLPLLPGLTDAQKGVAGAIDVACPYLRNPNKGNVTPKPDGTIVERFTYSCTTIVQTSNALQPEHGGGTQYNLGLSNDELRRLIQDAGPNQMNAQGAINNTAPRSNLLAARLLDLRQGARGLSVSMNGVEMPAAVADSGGRRQSGGAASADSPLGGAWGGFVKIAGNWGKVDQTELQDPYKYDAFSILAGADYRVNEAFVIGGAVGYEDTRSRYDNSLGDVDAKTWSFAAYGTYTSGPWFVDGFASYGHVDYDTTRQIRINSRTANPPLFGTATASPNGDQWSFGIGTGYNYQSGGYTLVPFARLGYIEVKNKSFRENESVTGMGLDVNERRLESLQSALGATVSTTVNTASGVFTPYFTAQWMHEFKNDNPSIVAKFVNDPTNTFFFLPTENPTRDYAVFILGTSGTFANGLSGFLQFGAAAGLDNATSYSVVAGIRKEF